MADAARMYEIVNPSDCVTLEATDELIALASCLESAMYCSMGMRASVLAAINGERQEAITRFNDAQRGSFNNIGARCAAMAKAFRERHVQTESDHG